MTETYNPSTQVAVVRDCQLAHYAGPKLQVNLGYRDPVKSLKINRKKSGEKRGKHKTLPGLIQSAFLVVIVVYDGLKLVIFLPESYWDNNPLLG